MKYQFFFFFLLVSNLFAETPPAEAVKSKQAESNVVTKPAEGKPAEAIPEVAIKPELSVPVVIKAPIKFIPSETQEPILQIKPEEYQLDWKYRAGEYLIYDCERAHYACVTKEGQNNCMEERKYALETKARSYPCASLKKFENKKTCIEKGYQLVDIGAIKRFCYPK